MTWLPGKIAPMAAMCALPQLPVAPTIPKTGFSFARSFVSTMLTMAVRVFVIQRASTMSLTIPESGSIITMIPVVASNPRSTFSG